MKTSKFMDAQKTFTPTGRQPASSLNGQMAPNAIASIGQGTAMGQQSIRTNR